MTDEHRLDYEGDPSEHIAIVGMTGRFPGAKNVGQFWRNLRDGVESITFFTPEDLAGSNIEQSLLDDPRYVGADGLIEDMDMFDAEFFGIAPREAELMDPQHRFFLECAWELMEQAGYNSESYDGRVSVYGSANLSTYLIRNIMSNPDLREMATSFQTMLSNDKDFVATRVSYKMGLTGPSMSVATLCSSSCVAIHLACQALLNYQCDLALAGAVSLQVSRNEAFFYQEGGIGDPDGHCRAFDANASGTVSGSGIGLVALKRLDEALEEGDTIHAVIRGTAVNNDGAIKYSYTAPSIEGQAAVIAEAISLAEVDPETIAYVETHGTGTRLGDPIEIAGLTKAFQGCGARRKQYCAIGSVKTNIGHLVNAGGVASLIKTVLAMQHGQIPPSLNFERPNPEIDFANTPFFVNTELRDWPRDGARRRAGVSSFGIGGTNVHVVLEEAPRQKPSGDSRPWHLLTLSAKTGQALERQTANLLDHLNRHPDLNLADVAFTLQVGRRAFGHRSALLCRDRRDAMAALSGTAPERVLARFQESFGRPVAFVFPGLEELRVNVGLELYRSERTFRERVDVCAEILGPVLGFDLRHVLYPDAAGVEEAKRRLEQPSVLRAGLFVLAYALARLWEEWGIRPHSMVGEGVGEYVAACLAGVFSLESALMLAAAGDQGQAALTDLNPPSTPLISSVTGDRLADEDALAPDYWTKRVLQAACFATGVRRLAEQPGQVLIEVGPGHALDALVTGRPAGENDYVVLSSMCQGERLSLESLVEMLGRLWLAGAGVDWNGFHIHEHRRRIPLPTYPFERKRYWVEPVGLGEGAERASLPKSLDAKEADVADWFYIPSWRRSLKPAQPNEIPVQSCWLLFADEEGLGVRLAERLRQTGQRVFVVRAGPQFTKLGDDTFILNPARRIEYVALLNELNAMAGLPQRIVHLWSVTRDGLAETQIQDLGFYSLLFLSQALSVRGFADELRLAVIANHLQEVEAGDEVCPEKATLLGALRVIPQEFPNVACRSIDILLPELGVGEPEHTLIDHLWSELVQDSADVAVAYRGPHRWVQAFERVRLGKSGEAASRLRRGGKYLILGGVEGIGLALAEHLVRVWQARLTLTRSSPGSAETLRRVEGWDGDVLIVDADVAAPEQISAAMAQAEAKFGRLDGIIYAAGGFGSAPTAPIANVERVVCGRQFRMVVDDLSALKQAVSEKELDFCLLTSSLSSVLGGLGLATYSAVNNFMDAFVCRNGRTGGTPWLCVNWDGWRFETGFGRERVLAHMEDLLITPAEGGDAFERIMACGDVSQLIVSTVDLQARIERWVNLESVREKAKSAERREAARHARPNLLTPYVAPRDETEQRLADIWQEVTGIEQVGIHDNFIELGGDSLIGVQVIARANEAGLHLTSQQLFQHQTIAELAAVEGTVSIRADQGLVTGDVPLTVYQQWFFSREFVDSNRWNHIALFEVLQEMAPVSVREVVQHLLIHHDALRTRFVNDGAAWRQTIAAPDEGIDPFVYVDLSSLPAAKRKATLECVGDALQGSLDLARGPLMRVALFKLGAGEPGRLLIVVHHLVLDGPSIPILLEDIQTAYRQLDSGEKVQLPPKTTSIKRWSERLNAYTRSDALHPDLDYWLGLPWDEISSLRVDHPQGRERNTYASQQSIIARLSVEETEALLRDVPAAYNAQAIDVFLTALVVAITEWAKSPWLALRVGESGRQVIPDAEDLDTSRTIGWLTLNRRFVLHYDGVGDLVGALESIREQIERTPNQGTGYELLRYCGADDVIEKMRRIPESKFDVGFNYMGQHEGRELGQSDLLTPAFEAPGMWLNPRNIRPYLLRCPVFVSGGRLIVRWMYSKNVHRPATIKGISQRFLEVLRSFIAGRDTLRK
jgi:non-ribosomal peptide synthase protein (TIGR01720 family)